MVTLLVLYFIVPLVLYGIGFKGFFDSFMPVFYLRDHHYPNEFTMSPWMIVLAAAQMVLVWILAIITYRRRVKKSLSIKNDITLEVI